MKDTPRATVIGSCLECGGEAVYAGPLCHYHRARLDLEECRLRGYHITTAVVHPARHSGGKLALLLECRCGAKALTELVSTDTILPLTWTVGGLAVTNCYAEPIDYGREQLVAFIKQHLNWKA